MSTRKNPALRGGAGPNPLFLPHMVRQDLMGWISKAKFPAQDVESFLDYCGRLAELVHERRQEVSRAEEKRQLVAIATKARSLLAAISTANPQTRETLEEYGASLPIGPSIGRYENNSLLPRTWDYVTGVERAATRAAEQLKTSAQEKPELLNGRQLTAAVVAAYERQFHDLPPLNRSGWFAGFMECLGAHLNMQCGMTMVSNAIHARKRPPTV